MRRARGRCRGLWDVSCRQTCKTCLKAPNVGPDGWPATRLAVRVSLDGSAMHHGGSMSPQDHARLYCGLSSTAPQLYRGLKIMVGFYQVVGVLRTTYRVPSLTPTPTP